MESRLFRKGLVLQVAGEIVNALRPRVPRPEVIDFHSVGPVGAFRQSLVRGLFPAAGSVGSETLDVDDGVPSPLQEEADDRQGPVHVPPRIRVHHVHGDEVAALEEIRDEDPQVGKEILPFFSGRQAEIRQIADGLEAHEDDRRRPGKEGEGRGEIRPAEGVKKGGRFFPGFPEVFSGPDPHGLEDGGVEVRPGFA